MHLLSTLITRTLEALGDAGILDWYPPDDNAPETFVTECAIEVSYVGGKLTNAVVSMCDRDIFLGRSGDDWHVSMVL